MTDDILKEIHAYRAEFARKHNYDMVAMAEAMRRLDEADSRKVVSFPPRPAIDVNLKPRRVDHQDEPAAVDTTTGS